MASLPETFEIDHASSSSGASLDRQLFRNDMSCPSEPHFSGFMLPPNDSSIPFLRSISHEQQNVSGWSLGEASSSSGPYRSINGDWKVESGWASTGGRYCPRIEEQLGPSNSVLSLDNTNINPVFVQGSGSSSIPPNVNSNGQYVGPSRVNPSLSDHHNLYKSSGFNDNQRFPVQPGNQVDPFVPSGSSGYVREESEVSSGVALDGRRFPCKRKSFEGHIGQSSFIENVNFPQPMESSPWQATPQCSDMNGRPGTQTLHEQVAPRLGLDLAVGAVAQSLPDTESSSVSYRNFRLRINSSGQSDMRPTSLSSSVVAAAGSPCITSAPQSSSRLLANHSLQLPTPLASSGSAPQELQPSLQVPVMVPGGHSVRWSRGLIPTNSSSSSSPIIPDEASSSGDLRNMLQHPVLPPSLSTSNRGLMSAGSAGFPANADSAPLGSSTSAAPQLPHHIATQPSHQHPRFPRRLSEYVHRQLLSSIGSDLGGGQGSQTSNSVNRPLLPQDVLLSSGPGRAGHRQSSSRSALWMERHGDSAVRIPYQARSLAAASGGRRRFASEVRFPACSLSVTCSLIL